MKRKVCVVTGSRADYGLLMPLMKALKEDKEFDLELLVTGMHLSPEFGLTYRQIEEDGFLVNERVEMLMSSDTDVGVTKSIGLGIIGCADAFFRIKPAMVVILGDRFEAFAAATAAYLAKIPVVHIHGGELTEGASDDGLRHSITKMSYLHFTATEEYRKRVIQLGEEPKHVFNVGAIGIDNIKQLTLLSKKEIEEQLCFKLDAPIILITFHPVTLENNTAQQQFQALLNAIDKFKGLKFIFTLPNADANGRVIINLIEDYVSKNADKAKSFISLGQLRYLSLLQFVKVVLGNSSSGIIEVPTFGIPTVNIGDRQKGRVRAESIIDTLPDSKGIYEAVEYAMSEPFINKCKSVKNPFGDGGTTERIMEKLKKVKQIDSVKKKFFDLS